MIESALPIETRTQVFVKRLRTHALTCAIAIAVLYLPLIWLAFDFELSPDSGVLLLTPAYVFCIFVPVPFLGPIVCIGFLILAYGLVFSLLTRSRFWLILVCVMIVCISTFSSREIYQRTKPLLGYPMASKIVQKIIFLEIFL